MTELENQDAEHKTEDISPEQTIELVTRFHDTMAKISMEMGKVIVGQEDAREQLLITILVGGHCLITGLPGTAKTLMVQSLARALGLDSKRIQFTPDLMPADVTGTDIIDTDTATGERVWRFVPGPVFTNLLLADEVNRTPPKTQSALLEAMQEAKVTIRGTTHDLQAPFVVLATQNPIELEGTYPLPEAQLDRFIFNIVLDYLDAEEEIAVVERNTLGEGMPEVMPCTDAASIVSFQQLVRQVPVSDAVNRQAVELVRATRPGTATGNITSVDRYVSYGASVRAATNLAMCARARALLHGRYHVIGEDVRNLVKPILRHRLQLNYLAESDGVSVDAIVDDILANTADIGTE
jgi:MoxR-like ATPase